MNFLTILITGYCLVFAYGNTLSVSCKILSLIISYFKGNYRLRNHKRSFMGSDKVDLK